MLEGMDDVLQPAQTRGRSEPTCHRLKTWPAYFGAVVAGTKRFEVRRADRDFRCGDFLHLEEWDPDTQRYTGATCGVEVTYVLPGGQLGVEEGYVVLGIQPVGR